MVGVGCLLIVLAMYSQLSTNRPKEGKRRKDSEQETSKEDPSDISKDVFPEISGPSPSDSPGPLRPPRNGGLLRQRSRRGSLPPWALSEIAE